jgi:hypothetical protein
MPMTTVSRRTASKAQAKCGSRPATGKEIAQKAAGLLTGSRLLPRQAQPGAARALEAMVRGVKISLREAASVRVEVVFTPRGKIMVSDLARLPEANNPKDETSIYDKTAIATARKRGAEIAAKILSGPEMLTGERFAELVGMTRMAVHKKLKKHQILGLEGAKRGFRYPKWQLGDDGRPVAGLSDLLPKFGSETWAAYRFLLQYHAGLGEMTAIAALKAGRKKAVIEAAESALSGDFS